MAFSEDQQANNAGKHLCSTRSFPLLYIIISPAFGDFMALLLSPQPFNLSGLLLNLHSSIYYPSLKQRINGQGTFTSATHFNTIDHKWEAKGKTIHPNNKDLGTASIPQLCPPGLESNESGRPWVLQGCPEPIPLHTSDLSLLQSMCCFAF